MMQLMALLGVSERQQQQRQPAGGVRDEPGSPGCDGWQPPAGARRVSCMRVCVDGVLVEVCPW